MVQKIWPLAAEQGSSGFGPTCWPLLLSSSSLWGLVQPTPHGGREEVHVAWGNLLPNLGWHFGMLTKQLNVNGD